MRDQTEAFCAGEGDNWFARNQAALAPSLAGDHVAAMVARLQEQGASLSTVCEVGCANGWRLAALADTYASITRIAGCDVSSEAIADGRRRWPDIELEVAAVEDAGLSGPFDLVMVSFVLHWVARKRLARSIAAIDALVADGGAVIVADFLPDRPCARSYHHREDIAIYTYKQDYAACFASLGFYREVARDIYSHAGAPSAVTDPQDRASCAALIKSFDSYASG